jgi:hypothetical protein
MRITSLLYWVGVLAAITVIASCFMPWAYYPDVKEHFTVFYSFKNYCGRPGVLMVPLTAIILVLMLIPKLWAKRTNIFLAALLVGYVIKTWVAFTACYNTYCPEKKLGIYLMLGATIFTLIGTIFPNTQLEVSTPAPENQIAANQPDSSI